MLRKAIVSLFSLIVLINFGNIVSAEANINQSNENESVNVNERALVLEVELEETEFDGFVNKVQHVKLEILSGEYKGDIVDIDNGISGNPVYDVIVKAGDRVILEGYKDGDSMAEFHILQFEKDRYVYILIGIFIIFLVAIGGLKGLKTIITLALTMFLIFKVLLPLMLDGYNPILLTILIATVITIITILIVSGINKKSLAAILGTFFGVIIAGILAYVMGEYSHLTGLSSNESSMLLHSQGEIGLNFTHLLYAGIILGALGAVMDVSMSIASSMDEINKANSNMSKKSLFKSGMNVGKDIMGTMSNTLILAYTGGSITLILLFMVQNVNYLKIINFDLIASEIIRSFSGSIGLILAIPITALISAFLLKGKNTNKIEISNEN